VNQLSTTTNPTKTTTKSISQQANRVKFQSFKTKELKRKKKKKKTQIGTAPPPPGQDPRLHHLQAEIGTPLTTTTPEERRKRSASLGEIGKPRPRLASPSHRINHHHTEIGKPKPPNQLPRL
jgi:hypothetical protein